MRREPRGIFVVGTDTGVGKTFVAVALCRAWRRRGRAVAGLKPFESGCDPVARDAEALERAAESGLPLDLRCPFRYRAAVSPAVAAHAEGRVSSVAAAAVLVREAARGRRVVVESAGGLASPISGNSTNLDLAQALGWPTLIVARNALGTLSQLSLVADALRQNRLPVLGLVLSRGHAPADPSQRSNVAWAKRLTGLRTVVELPRASVDRAAGLLAKAFLA